MCLYKPSNMKNEYHEEQDQEEQQQMWFLGASGKPNNHDILNTITFKNFISFRPITSDGKLLQKQTSLNTHYMWNLV